MRIIPFATRLGRFFLTCSRQAGPKPDPNSEAAHKNEGFLKSAWHRLTHQHDNLTPDEPIKKEDDKIDRKEEERKSASGSG